MKITELIAQLESLKEKYGDQRVHYIDFGCCLRPDGIPYVAEIGFVSFEKMRHPSHEDLFEGVLFQ